jgi:DNA-binding transcriptional LysR family regulator
MELHQLEYLVAVAEEASFTRAAARVRVAQPAVSAQIRKLEGELGVELIDRSARPARLTAAGQAVLPHARSALRAVAGAQLAADELCGLVRGQVRVGMVSGCAVPELTDALAGFHHRYPGIAIALFEDASSALVTALREGSCDLALIGTAGPPADGLSTALVAEEPLVAAVTPDHPLAGRSSVPLRSLAGEPLICLPPGTGVRAALDAGCAAAGFTPTVAFEASALPMVARLAERGLGIAVTPSSTVSRAASSGVSAAASSTMGPGLRAVPITEPGLSSRLEFAWNPAVRGPAARMLAEHARSAALPV